MKLIHTRTNQLRCSKQCRVYEFGVFYNTYYKIVSTKLQYNYQLKDSFSLHLMTLIMDNSVGINHIITLLNYHNCLYYNHTKFGLNSFANYKTSYHEKQNKLMLNRIYDILVRYYNFNYNIKFMFKPELDEVYITDSRFYNKDRKIIDFANQDLINMFYEIVRQNEKIEKKLTYVMIYNLILR